MNVYQQSQQLWPLLVIASKNRQTLTYVIVEEATGIFRPSIGRALYPVQNYCEQRELPPLSMLVVQQDTGLPGEGLVLKDFPKELQRVFNFDWLKHPAPTEEDFRNAQEIHDFNKIK